MIICGPQNEATKRLKRPSSQSLDAALHPIVDAIRLAAMMCAEFPLILQQPKTYCPRHHVGKQNNCRTISQINNRMPFDNGPDSQMLIPEQWDFGAVVAAVAKQRSMETPNV
jgi:hypothetical protein